MAKDLLDGNMLHQSVVCIKHWNKGCGGIVAQSVSDIFGENAA
jgi:hypothetical protein